MFVVESFWATWDPLSPIHPCQTFVTVHQVCECFINFHCSSMINESNWYWLVVSTEVGTTFSSFVNLFSRSMTFEELRWPQSKIGFLKSFSEGASTAKALTWLNLLSYKAVIVNQFSFREKPTWHPGLTASYIDNGFIGFPMDIFIFVIPFRLSDYCRRCYDGKMEEQMVFQIFEQVFSWYEKWTVLIFRFYKFRQIEIPRTICNGKFLERWMQSFRQNGWMG